MRRNELYPTLTEAERTVLAERISTGTIPERRFDEWGCFQVVPTFEESDIDPERQKAYSGMLSTNIWSADLLKLDTLAYSLFKADHVGAPLQAKKEGNSRGKYIYYDGLWIYDRRKLSRVLPNGYLVDADRPVDNRVRSLEAVKDDNPRLYNDNLDFIRVPKSLAGQEVMLLQGRTQPPNYDESSIQRVVIDQSRRIVPFNVCPSLYTPPCHAGMTVMPGLVEYLLFND